ncbi:glycosyltransferase [Desertimonas flava]|uniref:glycosyltransferase n=1 Tax=Desertimonas flava TaxID=2064846 RepID=UPI000E3434D6|nr:glycosyltransferase [Desertimonas flava]
MTRPGRPKAVEVFVGGTGNAFMRDIADWLAEAATICGRDATVVTDRLPHDPGTINLVVAPHEFFALNDADDAVLNAAAAVSIPVMTEQPGTPWFQIGLSYCRPSALTIDINPHGVSAIEHERLPVRRLSLGAVPSMIAPSTARDIDVLFLGGDTPRRRRVLASLGPVLADRIAELRLFDFATPVGADTPGLVFGHDKFELLARSRILVNVHRDGASPGYFEWARMVEAMANGCAVVTEPCSGFEPLHPDRHFISTHDIAGAIEDLLTDAQRITEIGAAAHRAVTEEHPLASSLGPLLEDLDSIDVAAPDRRRRRTIRRNRIRRAHTTNVLPVFRPATEMRLRVYRAMLAEQQMRRDIDAAQCELRHGEPGHVIEIATPAHEISVAAGEIPEVSVIVTLFNYAGVVTETLESIVRSVEISPEIVVIDDHSSDDGRQVVVDFMERHPDVPILLLGREDNHGLAAARNLGIERSRADKIMVMDADNTVYPRCLRRLADTLDRDPDAAFAYATLEAFGVDPGLRSQLAWHVPWLCAANYIDAQAMVRRSTYVRHGTYRDNDEWVYGLEDWDLWLRLAAFGERGAHIPQMLGRYRTQASSMISVTNLAADMLREHIEQRYPSLPWR